MANVTIRRDEHQAVRTVRDGTVVYYCGGCGTAWPAHVLPEVLQRPCILQEVVADRRVDRWMEELREWRADLGIGTEGR